MSSSITNIAREHLSKIFWITIAWIIISVFQFLVGYTTLLDLNCNLTGYQPVIYFKGSVLVGLIAGLLGGSFVVILWEKWLRSKRYGVALFSILWSYALIYIVVSVLTGLYLGINELGVHFLEPSVFDLVNSKLLSLASAQNFTFWLVVVLGTLIVLQVNDKYGPGVFRSFILGKYFQPQREERIFMFLDLRSSTTIAEKLGEAQYFNFLKDVFRDVTKAILNAKGEIYQYVGDEIVVSWKMNNGLEKANCITCFYEIQLALSRRKKNYEKKYNGILPEFKAGLHYGHVMAGEIGVVKREIAFSGDVLNTTSRIQEKCNELGVDLLLSQTLLDRFKLLPKYFHPKQLGEMLLRGKNERVVLYTM